MTPLSKRKTKLSFSTADEVRERGRYRQVIIEAHPGYATVRLQGMRTGFDVSYAAIYSLAVKQALAAERAAKAAKKKVVGK
jgi:hypothetical protein